MHREDEEVFEQEAKARLIQDGDDKWEASKWLGRTGWPRHLEGIDQGELKALMQAIGDDEPELQQMWRVFNTVLDEAYAATERCYPGTAELFEIARKEFLDHRFRNGDHYRSIIISALAIMGLADGGGDMDMIRYTTPGSETIDWRGDQIIHGRIRIRMGKIADILHNLVARARETLSRLTMTEGGGAGEFTARGALPVIPWSQIEDQHGESIIDHSFLRNAGNAGWLAAGNDWVIKMIVSRPDKSICIAVQPSDRGQPARLTEILGLQIWNTMNGGVRNIFIYEGMVCFITMYHKGFRQMGNTKIIHRYVPREGRLKRKRRRSAFLWADEVVSEEGGKEGKIREVKVQAQDGGRDSGRDDSREEAVRESLGAGGEYGEDEEEEAAFMEWFREKKWISDRRQMAIGISNQYFNKVFSIDDNSGNFKEEDSEEGSGNLVNSIEDL
ncbi:hypothetical protein LZL87_013969 [Fusarium oxysporum]|nr:hypothetical protein LZL87_013969 [Fusarium oxysporum]